jgi:tRNA nucleotidyltransferase/poly(A) polymerase
MKSPDPTQALRIWNSTNAFQTYFPELAEFVTQNDSPIWSRLRAAKDFRQTNAGWSMALFWSVLLYDVPEEIICSLFDRIHLQKYLGFPIRKAVLLSQHHADALNQRQSTIAQNLAREVFDIHFLCTVAHCIDPQGSALENLKQSVERGIDTTPLPRLLNGGDILQRGIQGAQIGALLTEIRFAQLQEIVHTREDALAMLDSLLEQS